MKTVKIQTDMVKCYAKQWSSKLCVSDDYKSAHCQLIGNMPKE